MSKEKRVKEILKDLYKIDSEFKKHEKKVVKIIQELLLLQPDIEPDSKFVDDLRDVLKIEAKNLSKKDLKKNNAQKPKEYFKSFSFILNLSKSLVVFSLILFFAITISFVRIEKNNKYASNKKHNQFDLLNETRMVKKDRNSFGNLSNSFNGDVAESKMHGAEYYGLGSASFEGDTLYTKETPEQSFVGEFDILHISEQFKYNYIYTGDDFELFNKEESVYKKVALDITREFSINMPSTPFFNSSKLKNTNISNFDILEDRDFGYSINFNLEDASASLYKNWKKWPRVADVCGSWEGNECIGYSGLSFSEMLSDEEVLFIANNFIGEYGVDMSNYSKGEVQNDWISAYNLSEDKESYYIPESISVIYPLKIENKIVYEEYGDKSGLIIEVDLREKRVASAYSLVYQNYEASNYETERSSSEIMNMLSMGGAYPYYDYFIDGEAKVINVELDTPELGLVKIWKYDEVDSQELYVPAYIFPVVSRSGNNDFYRKNIIVPAIKDFFTRDDYILPRIMPAMNFDNSMSGGSASDGGEGLIEFSAPRLKTMEINMD